MSKLEVQQKDGKLNIRLIRARQQPTDTETVELDSLAVNHTRRSVVTVKNKKQQQKVLLCEKIVGSQDYILVFSNKLDISFVRVPDTGQSPLKRLILVKNRVVSVRLSKRRLAVTFIGCIVNPYKVSITSQFLRVDETNKKPLALKVFSYDPPSLKLLRWRYVQNVSFLDKDLLLDGEPPINQSFAINLEIDGKPATYGLVKKTKSFKRESQYYAPIRRTVKKGFSIHIRRYSGGGLVLVRRRLEDIEKTLWFRFIESRVMSFLLFHSAHFVRRLSNQSVNIYFEKLASKAEEGTFQVFQGVKKESARSKNYFIINQEASDYQKIRSEGGIVKNFTLKSYWLLYRANTIISTESQINVNIMRSSNYYVRMAPSTQKFIFLQHGITYLKCQGAKSAFLRNRENEPDLIVVGSEKEQDAVADMLMIEEERMLNVGLPVFDTVPYGAINQRSEDIVTIMLTWRPYEEHLYDFSKSVYYQSVVTLYDELIKHTSAENIKIVAHPKFVKLLKSTPIGDSISTEPVSTVLQKTKLLITDYSSVAYYSFYVGGAVIFYQADIEQFESVVGKLVPNDDEYIGFRAFNEKDVQAIIRKSIKNGVIDLAALRTPRHKEMYTSINRYSDGKNVERLIKELAKRKVI